MKRGLLAAGLLLLLAFRVDAAPQSMVAAAHPLAVDAGVETLRHGGTAMDAAIAVQMVLGVVEPQASGLGGGGFLLYYDAASDSIDVYDGRETAPAGATPGMFLGPGGKPLPFPQAVASGISVGVPGALAMLELAHKEHGKLAWHDLFQPAIGLARDGFGVPPRLAAWLEKAPFLRTDGAIAATYFNADGTPRRHGERMSNRALADIMQAIAGQGAKAFYAGDVAREIAERVHGNVRPGTLSEADLADYRPVKREALCGPYRVWIVCGMPPPSSGAVAILQALALLEPFDLAHHRPDSVQALHLIAEANRLAFADRDRYIADPAFVTVPVAGLLSKEYLDQRRKLMSPDHAMGKIGAGVPPGYVERGTSHISIVDRWGNAVSFTTTIEAPFGAEMMVRGFLLNNELTDFSPQSEIDGRAVANRVEPGKRPRSSMSPTLVFDRDRKLVAVVGSSGGARIIGDTLQAIIGLLDWNLSAQQALAQPRVLNVNGVTELEDGTPLANHAESLRALGHQVQLRKHDGGLSAIRRTADGWEGAADPRRDGTAQGD
jgi:gamma-glutamyltranspeptidase/glutathione hydrolase